MDFCCISAFGNPCAVAFIAHFGPKEFGEQALCAAVSSFLWHPVPDTPDFCFPHTCAPGTRGDPQGEVEVVPCVDSFHIGPLRGEAWGARGSRSVCWGLMHEVGCPRRGVAPGSTVLARAVARVHVCD